MLCLLMLGKTSLQFTGVVAKDTNEG